MEGGESCLKVLERVMTDEELRETTGKHGQGREGKCKIIEIRLRTGGWPGHRSVSTPAEGKIEVVWPLEMTDD